jgi:hypothetical protein
MIGRRGARTSSHPPAADRAAAVPLRQERGAASARARARGRPAPRARRVRARARPATKGSTPRGRRRRWRSSPRSSARSSSCPTSSRGQEGRLESRGSQVHRDQPRRSREPAALQAHLPRGAEAADRGGHLRPRGSGHHSDREGHALPTRLETAIQPQSQRGDHLHDGRLRLDGDASRRRSCASRRSGSTPGCAASTRTSRSRTSSTTPSRTSSISTRSSTCASLAGPRSLRL